MADYESAKMDYEGAKVSEKPHPNNILEKLGNIASQAGQNLTNPATRPLTPSLLGLGMSAFGKPEESAYPLIGGLAGGILGTEAMHPSGGAGVGAGIGSGIEQFVKEKFRGGEANYMKPPLDAAITYGGGKALEGAQNVFNTTFPGASKALSGKISQGVEGALKKAKDIFGSSMKNLEGANPGAVDFDSALNWAVNKNPAHAPELTQMFEELPTVKYLRGQGKDLTQLSLPESQTIVNEFKDGVRSAAFTKGLTPSELPTFSLMDELTQAQDFAHPQFGEVVRPEYAKIMDAHDTAIMNRYPVGDKLLGSTVKAGTKKEGLRTLIGPDLARQTIDFQKENAFTRGLSKLSTGAAATGAGVWLANKFGIGKKSNSDGSDF